MKPCKWGRCNGTLIGGKCTRCGMKFALLLLLLTMGCVDPAKNAREIAGPDAQCLTEDGKHSKLTFCLTKDSLVICGRDGCLRAPLMLESIK